MESKLWSTCSPNPVNDNKLTKINKLIPHLRCASDTDDHISKLMDPLLIEVEVVGGPCCNLVLHKSIWSMEWLPLHKGKLLTNFAWRKMKWKYIHIDSSLSTKMKTTWLKPPQYMWRKGQDSILKSYEVVHSLVGWPYPKKLLYL